MKKILLGLLAISLLSVSLLFLTIENTYGKDLLPVTVKPILFIPKGENEKAIKEEYSQAIKEALYVIREFFFKELGETFETAPLIAIAGVEPLDFYLQKENVFLYMAPFLELEKRNVITLGREKEVHIIFIAGRNQNFAGAIVKERLALVAETTLKKIKSEDLAVRNAGYGTIAHELAHAFSIPLNNNESSTSIMGSYYFRFPFVGFDEKEKLQLKNFFYK